MYYLFDDYESKFYKLLYDSEIDDCKDIQRSYIEDKVYSTIRMIEDFGRSYCSPMVLYHKIYDCFIHANKQHLLSDYKIENYEDFSDELNLILSHQININNLNKYHAYIIAEHSFEDKYIIKLGFYHYPMHYSLNKELFCELNTNYLRYGLTATPNKPIYLSLKKKDNNFKQIVNSFYHYYDNDGIPFIINLESIDIIYDTPFRFHLSGTSTI